jgi:hypothetical protein
MAGMHLMLKKVITILPQQVLSFNTKNFNDLINWHSFVRPRQALGIKRPADLYTQSSRKYWRQLDVSCPIHDKAVAITIRRHI